MEFFNYLLFYFREKKRRTLYLDCFILSLCKVYTVNNVSYYFLFVFTDKIYESFQNSFKFHIHSKFCCIGIKLILVGSNNKHRRKQTKSFLLHSFLTSRANCSETTRLNVKPVLHILFQSFINYYNNMHILAHILTPTHSNSLQLTQSLQHSSTFPSQFHQHHKIIEIN